MLMTSSTKLKHKGSGLRAFLLFLACGFAFPAAHATLVLCKADKTVRSLRVDKAEDGTCKAVYTKQGADQIVGSSMHEEGCQSVIEGIRKKLEDNVWKCKDVKDSSISYISGE